jgi:hypothetical protein
MNSFQPATNSACPSRFVVELLAEHFRRKRGFRQVAFRIGLLLLDGFPRLGHGVSP